MMKRIVLFAFAALSAILICSCEKQDPEGLRMSCLPGEWELYKYHHIYINTSGFIVDTTFLFTKDEKSVWTFKKDGTGVIDNGNISIDRYLDFNWTEKDHVLTIDHPNPNYGCFSYQISYLVRKEMCLHYPTEGVTVWGGGPTDLYFRKVKNK